MRLPLHRESRERYPVHLDVFIGLDAAEPYPFVRNENGKKIVFVTEEMVDDIIRTLEVHDTIRELDRDEKRLVYYLADDFRMLRAGQWVDWWGLN